MRLNRSELFLIGLVVGLFLSFMTTAFHIENSGLIMLDDKQYKCSLVDSNSQKTT